MVGHNAIHRGGPLPALLLLVVLVIGCGTSSLGELIAGTVVTGAVTAHRAVTPGECRDVGLEGPRVDTPEALPAFASIEDLHLGFTYEIWEGHRHIPCRVTWRRGGYRVETDHRIGAGRCRLPFPREQVAADLGEFWAGRWEVVLHVKGKRRETLAFRLINTAAARKLWALAARYRRQGEADLAAKMAEKARRCDPFQTRR